MRDDGAHPVDVLPEYVRGAAPDPEAVRRHLAACEDCRREAELLRSLADAPVPRLTPRERERVFAAVGAPGRRGGSWRSAAWKVAAAIALLATGLAVWQVNRVAPRPGEWDPAEAVRAWEADLADLRPDSADVRIALGYDPDGPAIPWGELEPADAAEVDAPWEEDR